MTETFAEPAANWEVSSNRTFAGRPSGPFPGGYFNFVCTGVCGHTAEKLIHLQTKAGLSINKNRSIPRLCKTKHEPKLTKLQQVLFNFMKTTHS